jgi:hypothetical protein
MKWITISIQGLVMLASTRIRHWSGAFCFGERQAMKENSSHRKGSGHRTSNAVSN